MSIEFGVGAVTVRVLDELRSVEGKPIGWEGDDVLGRMQVAYMMTPDGGNVHVGLTRWDTGHIAVAGVVQVAGPAVYGRVVTAGRLPVEDGHDGTWSARLRGLKYKPEEQRANLAGIPQSDLDKLFGGDAFQMLFELGASSIGTAEEVLGVTNRTKSQLAVKLPAGEVNVLFAAFALTRILPIMNLYGYEQVGIVK